MQDVSLDYLDSNKKPIKNRARIRFHTGTSEVMGILALLDRDELAPGDKTVAQIRLDEPVAVVRDDRFVIRSYSPVRTVGGGRILNPVPVKHKRFREEVITGLNGILETVPEPIISFHAASTGYQGVSFSDLKLMTNLADKKLETVISALLSKKELMLIDRDNRVYIHGRSFEHIRKETTAHLEAYHAAKRLKAGMPKEELKSKLPAILGQKLFTLIINHMVKEETLVVEEETVRLATHKVSLAADQSGVREKILASYRESGLQPPYFKELSKTYDIDPADARDVLFLLVDGGDIIKVKEDLYFDARAVAELEGRLVKFLQENGEITTPQFKDMTGASRKYVIPLIEYFDSQNVTIRIGDIRKLRKAR
jgi:selenocysteine-specific elongation factor